MGNFCCFNIPSCPRCGDQVSEIGATCNNCMGISHLRISCDECCNKLVANYGDVCDECSNPTCSGCGDPVPESGFVCNQCVSRSYLRISCNECCDKFVAKYGEVCDECSNQK